MRCTLAVGESFLPDDIASEAIAVEDADVIVTTPEKWDNITRQLSDNRKLIKSIRLFMIDEIHTINDVSRGPTLEAMVTRMKMRSESKNKGVRFIVASATIPNGDNLAEWLSSPIRPAECLNFGEEHRPVKLNRIVIGYGNGSVTESGFKFAMNLNYRLGEVLKRHSDHKPALVFCSTRKDTSSSGTYLLFTSR